MFQQRDMGEFPRCPNCKAIMARGGAYYSGGAQRINNTVPIQGNAGFWGGANNIGHFVCPGCNWQMYADKDPGSFPKCPRCRSLMARIMDNPGGGQVQNMYPQQGAQNNSIPAPPIYSDAKMPHAYRGVCSNCHQILNGNQPAQPAQGAQAAWGVPGTGSGGGTCILR